MCGLLAVLFEMRVSGARRRSRIWASMGVERGGTVAPAWGFRLD
jgi:hypothetical protein